LNIDFLELAEASPNPYVLMDRDLRLVWMNLAYCAVTMRAREDIIDRKMFDAFPADPDSESYRQLRESLDHVLETGEPDLQQALQRLRPNWLRPRGQTISGRQVAVFIDGTPRGDVILEPVAQLSVSNKSDIDPRIPNEDSQVIELDESSLFRMDRFSGYDLVEGGARFTAGARATIRWSEGRSASLFVGRSYRADDEDARFPA